MEKPQLNIDFTNTTSVEGFDGGKLFGQAEVNEDEDELEEGKEVEEPSLYEGEEPLKDISDEEKAEYLVYMTGMDYNEALMKVRQS